MFNFRGRSLQMISAVLKFDTCEFLQGRQKRIHVCNRCIIACLHIMLHTSSNCFSFRVASEIFYMIEMQRNFIQSYPFLFCCLHTYFPSTKVNLLLLLPGHSSKKK